MYCTSTALSNDHLGAAGRSSEERCLRGRSRVMQKNYDQWREICGWRVSTLEYMQD